MRSEGRDSMIEIKNSRRRQRAKGAQVLMQC